MHTKIKMVAIPVEIQKERPHSIEKQRATLTSEASLELQVAAAYTCFVKGVMYPNW